MKKYDVIIIGAGLSGCILGYLLKKQNKKVLIIEKHKLKDKNKLCGGLLTVKSYDALSNIFGANEIESLINTKYTKGIIHNNETIFNIYDIKTYSVYRKDLDDYVLNKYLSVGGEIIENTTYNAIDTTANTIIIGNNKYEYNHLVGADGVLSRVRKDITNKVQRKNFAYEAQENISTKGNIEIFFFDTFKGYAWILPNSKFQMIGIGNVYMNDKIENDYSKFLSKIDIEVERKKGAYLPTGDDIILKQYNVYFVGDAAGLISPITGEGIYYAIESAIILSNNMSENYIKRMKPILKIIRKDLFSKMFVYNFKIRNYLFSRYNKSALCTKIINHFARRIL